MHSGFFPKSKLWNEKTEKKKNKNNFTVEKPGKHCLSQVIMIVDVNHDYLAETVLLCIPLIWCDENRTYLFSLLTKNLQVPQSNHKKHIRQIPVKGHYIKYLNSIPQNSQGHQKWGNSERFYGQKEPKETGWHCNIVSWMGSWNRKKTLGTS